MNKSPKSKKGSSAMVIISTIGDTTWRMFIPSIGCTILGVMADRQFDTKPWFTITGVSIGVIIAAYLVHKQIVKVQKN